MKKIYKKLLLIKKNSSHSVDSTRDFRNMPWLDDTLICTLVLDQNGLCPNWYDCSPFSSHLMLRSKRIRRLVGVSRTTVASLRWSGEVAINQAVIRMYQRVAKDVGNEIGHKAVLHYLQTNPDFLGPEPIPRTIQIICKPSDAERLAQVWAFLNPIVYSVDYMGTHNRRSSCYFLLPAPEALGVAPVHGEEYGMFVRESRRVVAVSL